MSASPNSENFDIGHALGHFLTKKNLFDRFVRLSQSIYIILLTLVCFALLNSLSAETTGWITPANNELPLGSSTGILQFVFEDPVDFPAANQTVQVWLDQSDFLLYYAYYDGTEWIAPENNTIPLGLSSGFYGFGSPVYDPSSGQLIQIWQGSANGPLYYATYDGTSWTAPSNNLIPLGDAPGVFGFNDPIATNQFMVIWEGVLNGPLYYATYDGATWTASSNQIPLGASGPLRFFYSPCYNPVTHQVMQIWQDTSLTNIYYSVFDGTSWSSGSPIPLGLSTGVGYGAFTNPIYYSPTNQIVEIWQNTGTNGDLFYSVFDGTNWVTPIDNQLPLGSSSGVGTQTYASPVYDVAAGQLLMTWQDSVNFLMYYASYNGSNWSANNNLIPLGASTEVDEYLDPVYDPFTGQVVLTWLQSSNNLFYYASYDGNSWSAPTDNSISLGLSSSPDIFRDPVYNSGSGELLLVWQDFTNNNRLFYSAYDLFPPSPPSTFTGKVVNDKFLFQTDRINVLTWTPSTDPSTSQYLLRRNGDLIFVGSASGPFTYADHNRQKNTVYTYTLTSKDPQGLESSPLTVTIQ